MLSHRRTEKSLEISQLRDKNSNRNLSMDNYSVALFSSYGNNDCIQEVSVCPSWRLLTEQPINPQTILKRKAPKRYNFNYYLAQNRLKAGKLMKVQCQGSANFAEMRKRFLKLLVYMLHAEVEINFERAKLIKNNENNIKHLTHQIFGRGSGITFIGLKNKLEAALNIELDPSILHFIINRTQSEVNSF